MTFGDLLDRFYDRVGDRRVRPLFVTEARAKELINAGFRRFRIRVQDHWVETQASLVAGTAVYNLPAGTVRMERLAYDDRTVRPVTILELVSENYRWQAQTGDRVRAWTTEDVDHNQYRVYPTPTDSTAIATSFTSEEGITAYVVLDDGTDAVFSDEEGIVGQVVTAPIQNEEGAIGAAPSTGAAQLTLWLVDGTTDLQQDSDSVQIRDAFALAALYDALAETYSERGDHYNPELSAYYEARFDSEVALAGKMFNEMMAHMLMGVGMDLTTGSPGDNTWPAQVTVDGNPMTVGWPRECFPTDGDEFFAE